MSYLRYVRICKNDKDIFIGWFNYDLYVKRNAQGNIEEFQGKFAKYIKGFCTIDISYLNSFNCEYNNGYSALMFRGIVNKGKIVDIDEINIEEEINYNTNYEIWYNDTIIFSGSLKLNDCESDKYEENIDKEDISEIMEIKRKQEDDSNVNIKVNMKKQFFASLIDKNGYYSENIKLLENDKDFFYYEIEELMENGTFTPKDDYVKRGEIKQGILKYESGAFTLLKDNNEYYTNYIIENDNITLKYKNTTYIFNGTFTNKTEKIFINENINEGIINYFEFIGKLETYVGDELKSNSNIKIIPKILTRPNSVSKIKNLTKLTIKEKLVHEGFVNVATEKVSLNDLIGLDEVKNTFNLLSNFAKYKKILKEKSQNNNLNEKQSMHMVFKGNPGTGKTTVAKRVANLLYQYGVISTNNCIVAHRNDLVAEYIGQTEAKVKNILDRANGGVLFIDEAYMLLNEAENDYGRIALIQIMNAMDLNMGNLVVILAGYKEKMKKLLELNEGLASRIKWFLDFEDYNEEELGKILIYFIEKYSYKISEKTYLYAKKTMFLLQNKLDNPKENTFKFGNGRGVREFYEFMEISLANRMVEKNSKSITLEELKTFDNEDVDYASEIFLKKALEDEYESLIGFKL